MSYQDMHYDSPKDRLMAFLFGPFMVAMERKGINGSWLATFTTGVYVSVAFYRKRKVGQAPDWYGKGCLALLIAMFILSMLLQIS